MASPDFTPDPFILNRDAMSHVLKSSILLEFDEDVNNVIQFQFIACGPVDLASSINQSDESGSANSLISFGLKLFILY